METITQNDDELIDHVLLKKVQTDTTSNESNGPKGYQKLNSRRCSGQQNKSVDVVFQERIKNWKKKQLKSMTLSDQLDFRNP